MKAIVYRGNQHLEFIQDRPEPTIKHPSQIKIKIDYCGICGSDLHEFLDGPIFLKPEFNSISHESSKCQIMGHEMCGVVTEVGENVSRISIGDNVVVEALGSCKDKLLYNNNSNNSIKQCGACNDGFYNACDEIAFNGLGFSDGGFAESIIVSEDHVIKFNPKKIPIDIAALCEPISVAWHGVRTSRFEPGQSVLVLGAGPIGLATIISLKAKILKSGLGNVDDIVVMEPAYARRKLAESFGVSTFDPAPFKNDVDEILKSLKSLTKDGYGYHRTYDCSGIPITFKVSVEALRACGHSTNLAIWPHKPLEFFPMDITLHERSMGGSISYIRVDFEQVIDAFDHEFIKVDDVRSLVTAIIPLEKGVDSGFKELIKNKDKHIKILLTPKDIESLSSVHDKIS